ncbi:hypothetical protein [Candidatus Neptunichlamydia sp. REUL1]|uniref:hypothetical protein n=1 Tax=Candidatus Neptunichlamydia sp. REUL1 TaxID=3064277 RepID=UPI002931EF37|nr:hypothetical protein [Candidatus Neptunochlamydia sp. REUL1]
MKIADPYLFYFSSIDPDYQGRLEAFSNLILRPIHVLTGLAKNYSPTTSAWESHPIQGKNYLDVAISIATVIPELVIRTLVKFAAHAMDKRMRKDEEGVLKCLPFLEPPNTPLERTHKSTWAVGKKILKLIAGVDEPGAQKTWASEAMRDHIIKFNELLKTEPEQLYQALENVGEQHWEAIWPANEDCPKCAVTYSVKHSFLVQLYFHIRRGVYYPSIDKMSFLEESQRNRLFFKEETPEYQLRTTFNKFLRKFEPACSKIDDVRLCAIRRIDENPNKIIKKFNYNTLDMKDQLIRQPEIQDAILANQK